MHRLVTSKLFNITTVNVKIVERGTKSKPRKKRGKPQRAKCPYLLSLSNKICERMVKEGLDGNVSDFDIQHFCNGNPLHCYYFRLSPSKEK